MSHRFKGERIGVEGMGGGGGEMGGLSLAWMGGGKGDDGSGFW